MFGLKTRSFTTLLLRRIINGKPKWENFLKDLKILQHREKERKMYSDIKYGIDFRKGLVLFLSFLTFFFFFLLLGPHLWHMEISRVGAELELQLLTCATATAMWDLSCLCELHHSSQQCWILNPLREARDQTCILMDTGWVCYHWATIGTP